MSWQRAVLIGGLSLFAIFYALSGVHGLAASNVGSVEATFVLAAISLAMALIVFSVASVMQGRVSRNEKSFKPPIDGGDELIEAAPSLRKRRMAIATTILTMGASATAGIAAGRKAGSLFPADDLLEPSPPALVRSSAQPRHTTSRLARLGARVMSYGSTAHQLMNYIAARRDDVADNATRLGNLSVREARDLNQLLTRFLGEAADLASRRARATGFDAERMFASARDLAGESAADIRRRLKSEVRNHPLQTLLVVAAAGIVLGWLGRR